jgi:hypothetical protein
MRRYPLSAFIENVNYDASQGGPLAGYGREYHNRGPKEPALLPTALGAQTALGLDALAQARRVEALAPPWGRLLTWQSH